MSDVGIIIVTFEPDFSLLMQNIRLINKVGYIAIIVDNSINKKVSEYALDCSYTLINLNGNFGIAHAQNTGILRAFDLGCDTIMLFDQDSELTERLLNELPNYISEGKMIVAPIPIDLSSNKEYPTYRMNKIGVTKKVFSNSILNPYQTDFIIASGMCISKKVFDIIGLFDEDFFIDFVDVEFCLRCKQKNIPIWITPNIKMRHKIGICHKKKCFIDINIHSPYRTYYKIRNCFLLKKKKFPFVYRAKQIISALFKNMFLLFFKSNSKEYRMYYFKGLKDGLRKRTGSFESIHE